MINYTSDDDNRHDPTKAEALETEAALRVIYEAHPEYNPKYERDALVREVALRKHILEQEKEIEKLMVGLEVEKEEVRRRDGWVRDMEEAMGVVTNVLVKQIGELVEARGELDQLVTARPMDEWHEDMGPVLWHAFPIQEPPYCGTPLDSSFPVHRSTGETYHTHWTPLPSCNAIQDRFDAAREKGGTR